MNKRAQGLSINAVILILLGLAVLVVLILGFTMGWNKLFPFFGGKNNIDTVVNSCSLACAQNSVYGFCNSPRDFNTDTEKYTGMTCYTLSVVSDFAQYGVAPCPSVGCKSIVKCDDWKYTKKGSSDNSISLGTDSEYKSSEYCLSSS